MGLPEAQRLKVDAWLFEEGWTYEEVVEGCLREFGLQVSKSSVGRYYERTSADRFAKGREKRMGLEPELSPAEAYKELLKRIAVLAWEEMDQPLEDINHKVVVRLVRVLIAARREKHQETRVWVERRKAENWLARECLRHWRREMKKTAHMSYLPIWGEGRVVGETPTTATGTVAVPGNRRSNAQRERNVGCGDQNGRGSQNAPPHPDPLPHFVAEREKSDQRVVCSCGAQDEGNAASGGQRSARPTRGCECDWREDGINMDNAPIRSTKAVETDATLAQSKHAAAGPSGAATLRLCISPGENTQECTIGLQSGENSITKFRELTINHN